MFMKLNHPFKIVLSLAGIGILFVGIYQFAFASTFGNGFFFESDRSAPVSVTVSSEKADIQSLSITTNALIATATNDPVFTAQTLTQYDGKNGAPAYVAVNGIVYDMTGVGTWTNGQHQGYSAGKDLSTVFQNSPHSEQLLSQLPIVGTYVESIAKVENVSNATVDTNTSASTTSETTVTVPIESIALSPSNQTASTDVWTYTLLSKYNGMGGQPAYIAVNGIIYNVTNIGTWTGGVHHGIKAGQDVTTFFKSSPHSASLLNTLPVVGNIGEPITKVQTASTTPTKVISSTDATTSASVTENHSSDFDDDDDHDFDDDDNHDFNDDHDSNSDRHHDDFSDDHDEGDDD